tara:strand:+ start:402 stop:689 length:288 start_codon:yes stop_codon:yes gene_type:complete
LITPPGVLMHSQFISIFRAAGVIIGEENCLRSHTKSVQTMTENRFISCKQAWLPGNQGITEASHGFLVTQKTLPMGPLSIGQACKVKLTGNAIQQ